MLKALGAHSHSLKRDSATSLVPASEQANALNNSHMASLLRSARHSNPQTSRYKGSTSLLPIALSDEMARYLSRWILGLPAGCRSQPAVFGMPTRAEIVQYQALAHCSRRAKDLDVMFITLAHVNDW
jgi:hypothetical protein